MDEVLGVAQGKYVSAFIDDILGYSTTWAEHLVHLDDVLNRLEAAGLTASPSKTTIAVDSIQYIGHVVSTRGVTADGENVAKIRDCVSPTNLKECRQAIGLLSYYRRLIPCFAQLCKPLHDCTKKPAESFEWTEEAEVNFHLLKEKLITAPILGLPDFKSSYPFQLYCDASGTGCGYNLTQVQPDPVQPDSTSSQSTAPRMIERVLLYGGAAWTDVQKRYSTIELEMLAIIVAVRKLHPYLFNRMTILYTDCKSLKFVFHNTKVLNDKVLRWVLTLSQYRLLVIHIAGKENVTSDYLSRIPQGEVVSEEDVLRVPLYSLEEACMPTCDRATLENINVQRGHIEVFHADVLVNPTNCQLEPRGGADRALQYAGGPDMLDHCAEIGTCLEGGIVVTPGYQLPCRYVAHVVGPRAYQNISLLESCYEKALDAMLNLGCTSICFPCISCGVFGFDKTRAARMAVGTCIRWLQRHQRNLAITFMIYPADHGSYQLYMDLLAQLSNPDPTTLPKLRTVAPSKLDLSTKLSVPIPAATLQDRYTTECTENSKPVLINFGRIHELPPTATIQDALTWSADLEKELVSTEPVNDEISAIQEFALPRDPWKFDIKEVGREQRLDPEWAACISKLLNEDLPADMSKNQLHAILCTINDYVVQPNGLLYRLWNKNQQRGKTTSVPQLCLPIRYREAVIANAHQLGHFGAMKVMLQLRELYHWPSMHQSVLTFLEGCTVCQYANARAHKRVPLNPPEIPTGPLEDVHVDILRMSVPSHGFNYVLVMICAFSRLTRCVAVKQKTAESTANAFYHGWLAVYGAPLRLTIYSDCGMEFRGAVFQCLVKSYGLRSVLTNYYSPTTNGICERLNRTILATASRQSSADLV
jgi:O-acetyl-ADP-ribose deacetylase (regulator of RNase III)